MSSNSNVSDSTTQAGDADGAPPAKRPMTNGDLTTLQTNTNPNTQLVRMICQDLHSYDIVNFTGFRNFFISCVPNYTLPSRQDVLEKLIPEEYNKEKTKLKENLKSVDDLAVSIEVWRSVNGQAGPTKMWTLTIHFIHKDQYLSQNLFTLDQQKANNATQIAKEIKAALIDWDILDKVVCFVIQKVHSNKQNLQLAVTKELKIPHVYCAAYALNQVVQDGLQYIYVTQEFPKRYKHLLKFKKPTEYDFYWHQYYTDLQNLKQSSQIGRPVMNGKDYSDLNECLQILKHFETWTNTLSSMHYTNLSKLLTLLRLLKFQIKSSSASTDMVKEFKQIILTAYQSNFESNDHSLAGKASFMDPRYKDKSIIYTTNGIKDYGYINTITDELYQRVMSMKQKAGTQSLPNIPDLQTPGPSSTHSVTADQERGLPTTELLLDFLNEKERTREFRMVLYYKNRLIHETVDPFMFWKMYRLRYLNSNPDPTVREFYKMSQKYLCIPATAVPVETIPGEFLWAKTPNEKLYNERRERLPHEKISEILFLHHKYLRN